MGQQTITFDMPGITWDAAYYTFDGWSAVQEFVFFSYQYVFPVPVLFEIVFVSNLGNPINFIGSGAITWTHP